MFMVRWFLMFSLFGLAQAQQSSPQATSQRGQSLPPASCPVTTRPEREFIPPADYRTTELPRNVFLIGSNDLWTQIFEPFIWDWHPRRPGHELDLTNKIFWFRDGYNPRLEPQPDLKVTGKRLDGPGVELALDDRATNAFFQDGRGAMLSGVYLPAPGCWEITGDYKGNKLSFVVWVRVEQPEPVALGKR